MWGRAVWDTGECWKLGTAGRDLQQGRRETEGIYPVRRFMRSRMVGWSWGPEGPGYVVSPVGQRVPRQTRAPVTSVPEFLRGHHRI